MCECEGGEEEDGGEVHCGVVVGVGEKVLIR